MCSAGCSRVREGRAVSLGLSSLSLAAFQRSGTPALLHTVCAVLRNSRLDYVVFQCHSALACLVACATFLHTSSLNSTVQHSSILALTSPPRLFSHESAVPTTWLDTRGIFSSQNGPPALQQDRDSGQLHRVPTCAPLFNAWPARTTTMLFTTTAMIRPSYRYAIHIVVLRLCPKELFPALYTSLFCLPPP